MGTSKTRRSPTKKAPAAVIMETKKVAVVRSEAGLDAPVVDELPAGTAVQLDAHRCTVRHAGRDVDRVRIARPVPGYVSFKCLAASALTFATAPGDWVDARVVATLEAAVAGAAIPPVVTNGDMVDRCAVLGFWGSSHALLRDQVAMWTARGFGTWTHVPAPGDATAPRFEEMAAFLAGARGRVVVHALSNNGFTFVNDFCEERADVLAAAAFVFDSAPDLPATSADARDLLVRAQTARVCQAFKEPPDPAHATYLRRCRR